MIRSIRFAVTFCLFSLVGLMPVNSAELDVQQATTPSGLNFFYVKSDVQDKNVISFSFPGGTAHDLTDGPMTTYLGAGLMIQSAGGIKAGELNEELQDLEGSIFFRPNAEYLVGVVGGPGSDLLEIAAIANRVLTKPDFPKTKIKNLKNDFYQGATRYRKQQQGTAILTFVNALTEPHPYATNFIGDPERISQISRENLVEWHKNRIVKNGLIITAVGKLSKEKMAQSIDAIFDGVPQNGNLANIPSVVPKAVDEPIRLPGTNKQAMIIVGGLSLTAKNANDWSAAVMLRNMLAFGQNSRLFKKIRSENGKSYGFRGILQPYSKTGVLSIFGLVDKDGLDKTLAEVIETITDFRKNGPTDAEIAEQLAHFKNLDAISRKDHGKLSGLLNKFVRYGWDLKDLKQFIDVNETIDLHDPKYREMLLPEKLVIVVAE